MAQRVVIFHPSHDIQVSRIRDSGIDDREGITMKAIIYNRNGDPNVLQFVDREMPQIPDGHVRVRIIVSGVNPTDCRSRSGQVSRMEFAEQVPNQDGAGIIDAVAPDVEGLKAGQRVWLWHSAYGRPSGTAQEYAVVPARYVVPLPESASFDVGASLGIPALTAHWALTSSGRGPSRLGPGVLRGTSVLVHGGAGAVGHAAVQLAAWSGATVITTVSGPEKVQLARSAGAHHVVDYRAEDVSASVAAAVPDGVDMIIEVDLAANLATDIAIIAPFGSIVVYATGKGQAASPIPSLGLLTKNVQIGFVYTYTTKTGHKDGAVADINAAVAAGAMNVGAENGLPITRFRLEQTAEAHAAVEGGSVGKVLIDVAAE